MHYLETSAFTKLYIDEVGTATMLQVASESPPESLVLLSLTRVEFHSALRKRERIGDLQGREVEDIVSAMRGHFDEERFFTIPISEALLEEASGLIDRHPLRAYDALQLAGCVLLRRWVDRTEPVVFVCSDNLLIRAAELESLEVLNPARVG